MVFARRGRTARLTLRLPPALVTAIDAAPIGGDRTTRIIALLERALRDAR